MSKSKRYPILKIINAISEILSNDTDIAIRRINSNTATPQNVPVNFYKIVALERLKIFYSPAISIFSEFNIKFQHDSAAAEIIETKIFIDICCENFDLSEAIQEAYMFAEDVRETILHNKGLNRNVAECRVSEIEELGQRLCDEDIFKFAYRLHLAIKTR